MTAKLTRVLKAPDLGLGTGRASVRLIMECLHNDEPTIALELTKWASGVDPSDQDSLNHLYLSPREIVELKTAVRGIIEHVSLLQPDQVVSHGFEQVDCHVEAFEGKIKVYPDRVVWGEVGVTTPEEAVEAIVKVAGMVESALKVPTMHHSVAGYVSHY